MTRLELAWAAGLFEGEGSVRINKATRRNLGHLIASVCNTDRQVIEFFQERWPAYMKPATGLRPEQRPAWVWVIAARRAAAFLSQIQPYLQTDRVREKARVGLEFQQGKCYGRGYRLTDEYRVEQFNAYLWMKELNVRGRDSTCPDAKEWRRR